MRARSQRGMNHSRRNEYKRVKRIAYFRVVIAVVVVVFYVFVNVRVNVNQCCDCCGMNMNQLILMSAF